MSSIDESHEDDYFPETDDDNVSSVSLYEPEPVLFKVLTSEDVIGQMKEEMKNISEAMNIPPTAARIILNRYKWETQSLMEKFVASEHDRDSFFRDARIMNPGNQEHHHGVATVANCLICLDTSEVTGLQCGHKFCGDCWKLYLTTKISDYGEQSIPCPDTECNIIVDDATVKRLVVDPKVIEKYNLLICNSFVKCKKNLYWCKSPGCNYVIDLYDCTCTSATCKCGSQFCLGCDDEMHAPISCRLLEKWKTDDSATQSYISTNTKSCPNCRVNIEKNGGCPHMTCRNCHHQFCWKCLNNWIKHNSSYKCGDPNEAMNIRKNRTHEQRLKYCWDRYSYNNQTLKDEIQRFDIIWEQFEHRWALKTALKYIFSCRRFLMYSYAFVYYLRECNQVCIFEIALEDIEANTDRVSVLLENYIRKKENEDNFSQEELPMRRSIIDGAAHCDYLRKQWLEQTEEGKAKNTWEYRDN